MSVYYTKDHEWVKVDDDGNNSAALGISSHAAEELGDITFVELPEIDAGYKSGDVIAVVESVKAASDIFTPVAGTVLKVNDDLEDNPGLINSLAENDGWICVLKDIDTDALSDLMNAEQYAEYVK